MKPKLNKPSPRTKMKPVRFFAIVDAMGRLKKSYGEPCIYTGISWAKWKQGVFFENCRIATVEIREIAPKSRKR